MIKYSKFLVTISDTLTQMTVKSTLFRCLYMLTNVRVVCFTAHMHRRFALRRCKLVTVICEKGYKFKSKFFTASRSNLSRMNLADLGNFPQPAPEKYLASGFSGVLPLEVSDNQTVHSEMIARHVWLV